MDLVELARRWWLGQRYPDTYRRLMGHETAMLKLQALTPPEDWRWLKWEAWDIAKTTVVSIDEVASMIMHRLFLYDPRDETLRDRVAGVRVQCNLRTEGYFDRRA